MTTQVPQVLYLLHFSPPFRGAQHYLGITRADRIADRLRDHTRRKGATLTRLALEAGCTLTLVRLWPDANRQLERKVKWAGHFNRLCPLCMHRLPTADCRAYPPLVKGDLTVSSFGALNFEHPTKPPENA